MRLPNYNAPVSTRLSIPQAHQLARQHLRAGQFQQAESICRQILSVDPNNADVHLELGNALFGGRRMEDAIAAYQRALALRANFAEALTNLGIALCESGRVEDSIEHFEKAAALAPGHLDIWLNLGNALTVAKNLDRGLLACRRAVELGPNSPDAYENLGSVLFNLGNLDEALAAYQRAILLRPDRRELYTDLGLTLNSMGRVSEGIIAWKHAAQMPPLSSAAYGNLLYMLYFDPNQTAQSLFDEQHRWNELHAAPLRKMIQPHANDRNPQRRLRIGYVSPDFYHQAESFFVLPLLESHDHENFEVHCYSSVRKPDQVTDRVKKSADNWHEVLKLDDENLAAKICHDQIDILIDLTMHMRNNRMLTFARKPAPVQVTWLAYPGSTGLETIDYRLTDSYIDPDETDFRSVEEPIRLRDSWCVYFPHGEYPAASPLPAGQNGYITFGCLNNFSKINEGVLSLWARVMQAVPDCRLLLLAPRGSARDWVIDRLGVSAGRIQFVENAARVPYLQYYHRIDIALDPFPYNGITTTCDALWMGVPVLTLPGNLPASRAGLSLLQAAGCQEMVASTQDDYIKLASALSSDLSRLAELRSALRQRVQNSPLMDARRFARNVEAAYRRMWLRWCESPAHL